MRQGVIVLKIFNKENGIKKVYVQTRDIKLLKMIPGTPPSILKTNVDDILDDCFIEFNNYPDVSFFQQTDFIQDYHRLKKASVDELRDMAHNVWDLIEEEEKGLHSDENRFIRLEQLRYQLNDYHDVFVYIQGRKKIPLPVVPDFSSNFSLRNDKDGLIIRPGFDDDRLFVYRTDGERLDMQSKVNEFFIRNGIMLAMMKKTDDDIFFCDCNMKLSDNGYLIIDLCSNQGYQLSDEDSKIFKKNHSK